MANLTTKELDALSDQLNYEKLMACKYTAAQEGCGDTALADTFSRCAQNHKDNYNDLLNFLK